jgi:YgiT-type zinc finger domain-containing protein
MTLEKLRPFAKCPVCGGRLREKTVEKLLKGGKHVAVLQVQADVCQRCGERLYPMETVRWFEEIREKLAQGDVDGFQPVGRFYEVVRGLP